MKMIIAILMLSASIRLNAQTVVDVGQYVPLAAAVGLGFCNVEARHCLRERVALTATSFAALTAVTGGLKLIVSERRPDDSDNRSFPSGHSARAFAGAELVRSEYGWGWGIGAYALATGVGVLRITGDHHYTHDVIGGAAIGVLSSRLAYWLLPLERRLFGWDKNDFVVTALPAFSNRSCALALSISWK